MKDDPVVQDLISFFNGIRTEVSGLQKPPSTGELVGAAALLRAWPRSNGALPDLKFFTQRSKFWLVQSNDKEMPRSRVGSNGEQRAKVTADSVALSAML
jgi:hypothetical protein